MKILHRLTALVLGAVLLLGIAWFGAPAAQAAPAAQSLEADLIAYYRDYQQDAETDILRTLEELRAIDEAQYAAWAGIMDYWDAVNTRLPVNIGVTEDGLPQDDSLAIVVLGYALNWNGTMKPELVDRLETALACAEKYPSALVVVTGGGTALANPGATEGRLMGNWMLEHGLEENRLIVEDRASNTVGNAENTYNLLASGYPQVDSVVLVTSDYHVPRGSILFQSKFVLTALETGGDPLQIVSNAACKTGKRGYESIALQAKGVAEVAGVRLPGRLPLSRLSGLLVESSPAGDAAPVRVEARYDTGFSRDVSDLAEVTGFDPALGEEQTVTVSYTENGVTMSTRFDLREGRKQICDNADLQKLVADVEAYSMTLYTDASAAAFEAALAQARTVLEQGMDADAEAVWAAYENLEQAVERLVKLENIALQRPVTANCNQKHASRVTDGSRRRSSCWVSKERSTVASEDAELVIDLGGLYRVEHIQVYPNWSGKRTCRYELLGSTDGETWFKLGENTSGAIVTDAGFGHELSEDIAYLKLQGLESGSKGRRPEGLRIVEIEVYGNACRD